MKDEQIRLEMEVLSLLFKATTDQKLMLQGYLRKKAKQDLNTWINQGNKLMTSLKIDDDNEYMAILTDTLHLQMDEVRKAITELKERRKNEKI